MSKKFYFRLPVTKEKIDVIVDDDDAYRLRSELWKAKNNNGYIEIYKNNEGTLMTLGRELMGVHYAEDFTSVTHKNGNSLDFRKNNLLILSRSELGKRCAEITWRKKHHGT